MASLTSSFRAFRAIRLLFCLLLLKAGAARASSWVLDWNESALEAMRQSGMLSPEIARDMAMLQTAIYNAVEGIAGDHEIFASGAYLGPSGTAPAGASMEAATAAAAFTILQSLHPGFVGDFATLYTTQLSGIAEGAAKTDGINFGTLVANDILNWRALDGAADASDPGLYTPVGTIGHWQPTPPGTGALPGWGNVTTFGISGTAGFTTSLPGPTREDYLATGQYAADYQQVLDLGGLTSLARTADQLDAAFFWSGADGTVTVAGMWNQIAQTVAASEGMSLQDTARLFAALNVALADAAIVAWETKYNVDFWDPLSAIVNGDFDGNGATLGDEFWSPLLGLDSLAPSYFSDHSALSAAAAAVLASFFGDAHAFSLDSDTDGNGTFDMTRLFSSFSGAAEEAGMSQIWGGMSYETGHLDALDSGSAVGNDVMGSYFAPVPEPSGLALVILGAALLSRRRRA
ncbi:MAG TPA: hypothetical protein DIT64_09940 [Verrucomicrobiales bacterium]|nr:hypothetical protein [Verrucomicrobiales bacterium]